MSARGPGGVVYITGTYPILTTTFIDREIDMLRRRGIDVLVVAARRPPPDGPLSDEQRASARSVLYLTPIQWRRVIVGHAVLALTRPRRYFGTLAYLVTRPHPTIRARAMTVVHFAEGIDAAHLLRHRGVRALHAHFADRAATIAFVVSRLLGTPYSLSIHAGADIFVNPVLLPEKIRHADQVVTCTRYNKSYIGSLVGEELERKITSIPHGLDLSRYRPAPSREGAAPVILAVGQLTERKGFVHLIAACSALRDDGIDFRCRIVGQGPQTAMLQRLITESRLDGIVTLCGAMPHEDVVDEYRRATMFVLPCVRTGTGDVDGIPNVLAEAMALEVPVISSDLPAIRELVSDGVDGLLVAPGDVRVLASTIRHLMASPTTRSRLARQGRQTIVDTFDVESNVRLLVDRLWPDQQMEAAR